jgi:N-acetylglucosaminyl-diphospho-decaprenol L-rhamnosyltransferase
MAKISIIILSWNTRDLLAQCLDSIEQHKGNIQLEIIIVDNASTDGSQAMLKEKYPQIALIINNQNLGFAKANNQAMQVAQGDYFLLWNSDAFATPGAIQSLLQLAEKEPRAAIVGAQLRNADYTFQASYCPFPNQWREFLILTGLGRTILGHAYPSMGPEEEKGPQVVNYVAGACLLVRRQAFQEVGGFDEGYFMYAEEVDWCYTMTKHGWQVWYQPAAKVIHLGSASSASRQTQREADLYRSRIRFFRKNYGSRSAQILKMQIYTSTAFKNVIHGVLRLLTGGRYGRPVVSLQYLATQLQEV